MTAKEYLMQVKNLEEKINNACSELYRLKTMATSISIAATSEKVQTSTNGDRLADQVIKIIEAEDTIKDTLDVYLNTKKNVIDLIESLSNANHYNILYKKYVEFKTFEVIAEETNYSFRHVLRIHVAGLKEVQKILDNKNVS